MNRYENPPERPALKPSFWLRLVAPFGPVLGVALAAGLVGWGRGVDGVDRVFHALFLIHVTGWGMDLYTVAISWRCRKSGGRVSVPYAAPMVFGVVRLLLFSGCQAKVMTAGGLYAVSATGAMVPRTESAVLLTALGLVSVAMAVYEGTMVRMALCPSPDLLRRAEAPPADVPVGPEYFYEVQTILGALGFYEGPADGVPSPEVKEAVKRFQGETGLMAHGGLTAATVIELRKRWGAHQIQAFRRPGQGLERGNGRGVWTRIQDWLR